MANSISRLKGTDSALQWSQKVNAVIDALELYVAGAGSFTSTAPSISNLVVYDAGWKNKTLIAGDVVFDTSYSNATQFKVKLDNIAITGKTELISVDTATDFLLIYDADVALLKKVKIQNILSGVTTTPGGSNTQVQFNDSGVFNGDTGLTYNKTTDTLTIVGGLIVDVNTLFVDNVNNRVGILTITPAYVFDVVGDVNTSTIYRIGGNSVLSSSTLGSTVVNSSLTSIGTLSSLTVTGTVSFSSSVTALSLNVTNAVGIGTTDPTYKLHVVGTGYISGGLTTNVTGNVTGTSFNITQYTINQSVGTGNSPTFAGVTANVTGNVTGTASINNAEASISTITGTQALTAGSIYALNISASSQTLTLPASPTVGQKITFIPVNSTNVQFTIARNSSPIMSLAENLTVDVSKTSFSLIYDGATFGWMLI